MDGTLGATRCQKNKTDGGHIPVDPEPVFVIEDGGDERFYSDELGMVTGRLARPEEVQTPEQKINTTVAFVPHWRTCGERGRK